MALGSITDTTFQPALKRIYPQRRVDLIFYSKHAFLSMVRKNDGFEGENNSWSLTVESSPPAGGRSNDFTQAQANISTGTEERFQITRQLDYQLWQIETEVIAASRSNVGSLMRVLRRKGDSALKNLSRNTAFQCFNNGGGSRGVISTISGGGLVTLTNRRDIVHFERDMDLTAADWDGTGAAGTIRAGFDTIASVDRSAGTFLLTGAGVPTGWIATDNIFQRGDLAAAGGIGMTGVPGWIPTTAPTAGDNHYGVDRSVDTDRLAGARLAQAGTPVEEALTNLAVEIDINGGEPDTAFINPIDWQNMMLSMENKVMITRQVRPTPSPNSATFGFTGIRLAWDGGNIDVFADVDCPQGTGYVLQMDTWELRHLEGLPHMIQAGMGTLGGRAAQAADAVEFRARTMGNIGCSAPGWNGVVTF